MKNYSNRKRTNKVLHGIVSRFLSGEKLTVEGMVKEYFNPKTTFSYMVAKNKVRSWFISIKKAVFNQTGKSFGNIDVGGVFGVPTTMGESRYMMTRYYKIVKGNTGRVERIVSDLNTRKLLPSLKESKARMLEVVSHKK